jgi:organic radical activating enzyme
MDAILDRIFGKPDIPEAPAPGIYHRMLTEGLESPHRFHLRVEDDGSGVLIVDAAIVLHLNPTATEHAYYMIQGKDERSAAEQLAARYRVSPTRARQDQRELREKILALASTPDLDPVLFLDMERTDPDKVTPSAPYRLDCALTYRLDESGKFDPLARARVDVELSRTEWQAILKKAWEAGIPHATFTGGEPTLRDDLPELINTAEQLGQVTGLLTDGKRLSVKAYLAKLDQAGLDHILIVYDPDDARCEAGLKNALATEIFTAVHLLIEDKQGLGEQLWSHLEESGVSAISLSSAGDAPDLAQALAEARDEAARRGFDLIWDLPAPYSANNPISNELESPPSGAGRSWLYVEPDGDVLPSQGVNRILGNMLRDPWEQIWSHAAGG